MQHKYVLCGLVAICLFALLAFKVYRARGKVLAPLCKGDTAPDFALPDEMGVVRKLSDYRGHKVVLYFYPKDETPGCTAQACGLRDNYSVYQEKGIVILGVSYDTAESHKKFKEAHGLPFILLSDLDRTVAQKYGAYRSVINRLVPQRMTFLIDEHGVIVAVLEKVDVATHADEVLRLLAVQ